MMKFFTILKAYFYFKSKNKYGEENALKDDRHIGIVMMSVVSILMLVFLFINNKESMEFVSSFNPLEIKLFGLILGVPIVIFFFYGRKKNKTKSKDELFKKRISDEENFKLKYSTRIRIYIHVSYLIVPFFLLIKFLIFR